MYAGRASPSTHSSIAEAGGAAPRNIPPRPLHARAAAKQAAPVSPLAQAAGGGPRFGCEGFDLLNPCRLALWHGLNTTPGTRANLRAIPRVHEGQNGPASVAGPLPRAPLRPRSGV